MTDSGGLRLPKTSPTSSPSHGRGSPSHLSPSHASGKSSHKSSQIDGYDEHHQWAIEHWVRLDRDHDGVISRPELDSEEFRRALKSCLGGARKTAAAGAGRDYARTKLNIDQAIDFVRRKADQNADAGVSFEEFESFTRTIRYGSASDNAGLIFALFDLDGDNTIDEGEFREIYRYYLGRMPTEDEFQEEWARLDIYGQQFISKKVYIRWLQTSPNPIFHRHAPPPEKMKRKSGMGKSTSLPGLHDTPKTKATKVAFPNDDELSPKRVAAMDATTPSGGGYKRRMPVLKEAPDSWANKIQEKMDTEYGGGFMEKLDRPEWNKRHHLASWDNDNKPTALKAYFSRPQNVSELTRFYKTHRSFERHAGAMQYPEPRRRRFPRSWETKENPVPEKDRDTDGTMRSSKNGEFKLWEHYWQDPAWMRARYSPGTLLLRLPGDASEIFISGIDD